jgi:hypothetical protein
MVTSSVSLAVLPLFHCGSAKDAVNGPIQPQVVANPNTMPRKV